MRGKLFYWSFVSAGIGVLAWALWGVFVRTGCLEALPWDPASHALDGLRLYNNVRTFSPLSFWLNLTQMVHWPPLPPLLTLPFYFLFGPRVEAPTAFSLFCFLGTFVIAAYGYQKYAKAMGSAAIGMIVFSSLALCAPLFLRFSILVMYEAPGALITLSTILCLAFSFDESNASRRKTLLLCTAFGAIALLLTKWNFGLQFLLFALGVDFIHAQSSERRALISGLLLPYIRPKNHRITTILTIPFLAIAFFVLLTGGWTGEIAGVKVSITRLDNPLYGLFIILAIRMFALLWKNRTKLNEISERTRLLIQIAIIPFTLWLLYPHPNRIKGLLYHLNYGAVNPPSRFSWEVFTLYPKMWVEQFSVSLLQSALVTVAIFLALWLSGKRKGPRIVAAYVIFLWWSSTYLTTNREARFILHAVPCAFFVAGWTLMELSRRKPAAAILAAVFLFFPIRHSKLIGSFFRAETGDRAGWEASSGWCYGDHQMVQTIRDQIVGRSGAHLGLVTVGISDMTPLCPLVIWELNRANPRYSNWPLPKTCDYGYHVTAEQYVSRQLSDQKLDWLLILSRPDGDGASERVSELIKDQRSHWQQFPIELPSKDYSGTLYQIPKG